MRLPPSVQSAGKPIIGLLSWGSSWPCSQCSDTHTLDRSLDNIIGLFGKSWLFLKWLLYNWSMIIEEILLGFQSSKLRSTVYRTQFLRGKKLGSFLYKLFLLMCCCKQQMHDMPGPAKLSELFDRRSLSAPPSPILQREGQYSLYFLSWGKGQGEMGKGKRSSIALVFVTCAYKLDLCNKNVFF